MTSHLPEPVPNTAISEAIWLQPGDVRLAATLEVPPLGPGDRVPLAILLHGFTGSQDDPIIRATAAALAEAGIASLRADLTAHGASGGDMVDMTVPGQIEDARAVFEYARALPFVSGVGLVGHSQGGVVAAMLAGQLADAVSAVVLLAPATNIPGDARAGRVLGARFDPRNPPEWITLYGLRLGREYLRTAQALAIREVPARYHGPVSVIQGLADEVLPAQQAAEYVTIFDNGGLVQLPGQDHNFYHDPEEPAALATAFLTGHLRHPAGGHIPGIRD